MFNVEGTNIIISRGDTGALKINATVTRRDTGEPYVFGERDRAVFTVKNGSGQVLKERAYQMTNNAFVVIFMNADTDKFSPGGYSWDVRYVINPYYEEGNPIPVDGDQVITPSTPLNMNMLTVVGDI